MTTPRTAKAGLQLIAGCSLALLIAAGGAAFAHGGDHGGNHGGNGGDHFSNSHDHFSDGGHGRCIDCGRRSHGGDWDDDHHHHHHHPVMTGNPPLHGPASSHNPIVYHPPVKPISAPIVGVGPAKPTGTTVVRDHRTPQPHGGGHRFNPKCNQHNITGCEVRDHRAPTPTQCLGNLC